jgi:hypothetical protein
VKAYSFVAISGKQNENYYKFNACSLREAITLFLNFLDDDELELCNHAFVIHDNEFVSLTYELKIHLELRKSNFLNQDKSKSLKMYLGAC